jgi:hypothetical protein
MNIVEYEDIVLHHFHKNGFHITEWESLMPHHSWRPKIRVKKVIRGRLNDAAIIVREDASTYKTNADWKALAEVRVAVPSLSVYFAIPECNCLEPLLDETKEMGTGLYIIRKVGKLDRILLDRVPFDDTFFSFPIVPDLPYRNRINLFKVFDYCSGYLWWLDKHFRSEGFELLCDWCYSENRKNFQITEIKILAGGNIAPRDISRLRRQFPLFAQEMAYFGLDAQIRILNQPEVLKKIHDRYLISDGISFNVLPTGSLIKGQTGSLYLEDNPPDFLRLWNISDNL